MDLREIDLIKCDIYLQKYHAEITRALLQYNKQNLKT